MIAKQIADSVTSIVIDEKENYCKIDFIYNSNASDWFASQNSGFKNNKNITLDTLVRKTISKYYAENNIPNYESRFVDNFDLVKNLLIEKFISLK